MYTAQKFIDDILTQSAWFDMDGDCEALLDDWYADDISMIGSDDEDLAIAFMRLRNTYTFWRTGAEEKTPYQKLKLKYDALLEAYLQMANDLKTICEDNVRLAALCSKSSRKVIATQIKGGYGAAGERRMSKDGNSCVA
jgi:hypothetical protein